MEKAKFYAGQKMSDLGKPSSIQGTHKQIENENSTLLIGGVPHVKKGRKYIPLKSK